MGFDFLRLVVARLIAGLDVPEVRVLVVSLDVLFVLGLGVLIEALLGHELLLPEGTPADCRFSYH